jgi:hypothetical protein
MNTKLLCAAAVVLAALAWSGAPKLADPGAQPPFSVAQAADDFDAVNQDVDAGYSIPGSTDIDRGSTGVDTGGDDLGTTGSEFERGTGTGTSFGQDAGIYLPPSRSGTGTGTETGTSDDDTLDSTTLTPERDTSPTPPIPPVDAPVPGASK